MNDETPNPTPAAPPSPPSPPAAAAQRDHATMETAVSTADLSVAQRLKGQFAPGYLTLASIIQGVALSALVVRVESTYTNFDAVAWLLTVTTFLVIVDIWHEYLMMVLAYVWLPTLLDSLIPFGFVAAELFLGHFVYGNVRGWLLAYAGCFLVGAVAWILQNTQVRLLASENQRIKDVLSASDRTRGILAVAFAALSLAAWALYDVLRLGQAQLIIAILALIGTVAFLASSAPGWNRLLLYARNER
ncbi:MAG: hypothetical protein ACXWQR_24315 [Ktedonobacterales bacterium]